VDLADAASRVWFLRGTLKQISATDPEQEVRGIAIPVVDAVLTGAGELLPKDDPVIDAVRGLITPETIAEREPIRAVDAWIVADQLYRALTAAMKATQ
jgi:hypothetical protein